MPSEISRKLHSVLAREMGHMGKFILQKQCTDLSIDIDEVTVEELPIIAQAVSKAVIVFTGPDKARRIESEIKKLS